jgi:Tfp pilus assembly protein PilF
MSLLLDALKKAAEQKAQKSKSEASAQRTADQTLLEPDAERAAAASAADRNDETELDNTGINARLERGSVVRGDGDDTGLDLTERTDISAFRQDRPAGEDTSIDLTESTDISVRQDLPAGEDTEFDRPDSTVTLALQDRPADDDTRLDLADSTDTRIEQDQPPNTEVGDTGLDSTQADERTRVNLSAQLQTGDDETIVFESGDATDFVVEHDPLETEVVVAEDETDLSQPGAREDSTGTGAQQVYEEVEYSLSDDDETDVNELDGQNDLTGIGTPSAEADAMDPGQAIVDDDSARARVQTAEEDETDLSQSLQPSAEDTGRALPGDADPTDLSQPATVAEQIEPAEAQSQATAAEQSDDDETSPASAAEGGTFGEDLSLLLLEPDSTNPRAATDTAITNPRASAESGRALAAGAGDGEELALADTTQTRTGTEQTDTQGPTLTNPSETALYADETRTRQAAASRGNAAQGDPTSTRTYAPDNYDRTLMKLPSNDASKLFAGMKSDSDVVMTPDYAKKVFRSKTSAQRAQHYKLYGATAVVIVFAIGIFGMFEYQDESLEIDTSLRPLQRDPMPGVIKTPKPEETNLFAGSDSETTARTIEIIETAETAESAEAEEPSSGDPDLIAIAAPAATTPVTTTSPTTTEAGESAPAASRQTAVPPSQVAQGDNPGPTPAPAEPQTAPVARPVGATQAASLGSPEPLQASAKKPAGTSGILQIESSAQYLQSDVWLREAYAAYSAGDDQQALRLYNKVLKADPGNRNALLARAAINIQNGDVDAAIRDYRELLLQNPKDSLAIASLLAVSSYSPLETESQLKLMLYDEPDSPFLNFALANAYGAQNRWHEAQQYYFKALQTNPQDPNYAYNLAVSLEHVSQPTSAVTYYRRALDNFESGLATFDRDIVIQRLERLENL